MHLNATITDTEHIPGKLNVIFDGLSRNVSPQQLGLDPTLMYPAASDTAVIQFIALCDPEQPLSDITSHTQLLQQCQTLLLS